MVRHSPQESPDKIADRPAEDSAAEEPAAKEPAPASTSEPPAKGHDLLTCKVGFPTWFLKVKSVMPKR